jgi:hypothetical protein
VVIVAIDGVYVALVAAVVLTVWAARRRLLLDSGRERGAADDSFMKKVVKVALIVMLVAGGIVWLIDRADDSPPNSGSGEHAPDHPERNQNGDGKTR